MLLDISQNFFQLTKATATGGACPATLPTRAATMIILGMYKRDIISRPVLYDGQMHTPPWLQAWWLVSCRRNGRLGVP